jgi:hypothetical protein
MNIRMLGAVLGVLAQRAIRRNGAQWKKARLSSIFLPDLPDLPQRAKQRIGILWQNPRGKLHTFGFWPAFGAL